MPGQSHRERASPQRKSADGGAADRRTETAPRDQAPTEDTLGAALNQSTAVAAFRPAQGASEVISCTGRAGGR